MIDSFGKVELKNNKVKLYIFKFISGREFIYGYIFVYVLVS